MWNRGRWLTEHDLSRDHRSPVHPRLNYEQLLEMPLRLVNLLAKHYAGTD
jgi:hypothetical protein